MSNVLATSDVPAVAGPAVPDYELADTVAADTPARLKALGDRVRLTILDLVLERAMSVTELAARLARPKGTVAHHVSVLHDAGLLQVVRSRRVRAVEERFYGRTGRTIELPGVPGELPFLAMAIAEADHARMEADDACGGFSLRHARIPAERAAEWVDRVHALALEFAGQPRGGDTEWALLVGVFPTTNRVAPLAGEETQP